MGRDKAELPKTKLVSDFAYFTGGVGGAIFFSDFAYGYYLAGHRPLYGHPHEPWVVYFKGVQAVVYITRSEATIFNVAMAVSQVMIALFLLTKLVSWCRGNGR